MYSPCLLLFIFYIIYRTKCFHISLFIYQFSVLSIPSFPPFPSFFTSFLHTFCTWSSSPYNYYLLSHSFPSFLCTLSTFSRTFIVYHLSFPSISTNCLFFDTLFLLQITSSVSFPSFLFSYNSIVSQSISFFLFLTFCWFFSYSFLSF